MAGCESRQSLPVPERNSKESADSEGNNKPSGRSRDVYLDADSQPDDDDDRRRDKQNITLNMNKFGDIDDDDDDDSPNDRKTHGSRNAYFDADDGQSDTGRGPGDKRELNQGDHKKQFGDVDEDFFNKFTVIGNTVVC